jgi:hypothetical protein
MPNEMPTTARLEILVQRLLDAELLVDSQCAALMDEASAAGRHMKAGHAAEACQCVQRVVLFTDALVRTGALSKPDAHEVTETAKAILQSNACVEVHGDHSPEIK